MSVNTQPTVPDLLEQAEAAAKQTRWEQAASICERALALIPDDDDILGKYGWYLSCGKRYAEAISVFKRLHEKDPQKALWPYMIGYQYYDQKQWRDAIVWFDQTLQLYSTYLKVLYRKGYAHTQCSEPHLAQQAFEKCIEIWRELGPKEQENQTKYYGDACFQLGKLFLDNGLSYKAEKMLAEATVYSSPDPDKLYNYAKALLKNGKLQEAQEQLEKAERIKPGADYILVYLGRVYIELKNYIAAEAAFKRIPPGKRKPYVWGDIGKLYLQQGQYSQALDALRKATRHDATNHNYFYLLGQAYEGCGNVPEAYDAYKRAVTIRQERFQLPFEAAQSRLDDLEQLMLNQGSRASVATSTVVPLGYIKTFKTDRGFGFISQNNGDDVFFHISDVSNQDAIAIGAGVTFELEESPKGMRAMKVLVV